MPVDGKNLRFEKEAQNTSCMYTEDHIGPQMLRVLMKTSSNERCNQMNPQAPSTAVVHSSQEAFEVMRSLCATSASLPLSDLSSTAQL